MDGAVAFTQYFADQANQAYESLDANRVADLSSSGCKGCSAITDSIKSWKEKNYHYIGQLITPTFVTISAFPNDGSAKVLVSNNTTGAKLLDAQNSLVETFPPEQGNASFSLRFESTGWKVAEIQASS